MPSSDYSNAVGGGLKLKGAGIEKSKKKKKKSKQLSEGSKDAPAKTEVEANSQDALQNALVDEEKNNDVDGELQDTEVKELGRTEAQRRFEERRRKRVSGRNTFEYAIPAIRLLITNLVVGGPAISRRRPHT